MSRIISREIYGVNDYDFGQNLDIDEIEVESPTLFSLTIDCSPSMWPYKNVVPNCIDETKKSIINSKSEDEFLISVNYFNDKVTLGGYQTVKDVSNAYSVSGYTALYDAIVKAGNALKNIDKTGYYDQIKKSGGTPKAIFTILSDGYDNASSYTSSDAKEVIAFLNKSELITAYIAFGDEAIGIGESLGFANVMNVKEANEKELRKIFRILSKSAISASKSNLVQSGSFFQV